MDTGLLAHSRLDNVSFEPMKIDDESHGVVHWVRKDRHHGNDYKVAIWQLGADQLPHRSTYTFRNDETIIILEGELHITWSDGTATTFVEGDIASIAAGTTTEWLITKPFKKFVVEVEQ